MKLKKKKDNTLATTLKKRDGEWREELENRDKALRAESKKREKVFVNKQIKSYEDLLNMLEEREKDMEKNLLQKADAFGYLYTEH